MERRHTRRSSSMRESQSDAYAVVMAAKESSRERRCLCIMVRWCYGEMVRYDVEMVRYDVEMVRWWGVEICCGCFCKFTKTYLIMWAPSGFFIITAVPRSLTSAKSVDSVGGPTHPNHLCRSVKSVGEYQYSHGIHSHRTFLLRRAFHRLLLSKRVRRMTKKKDDTNHSHRPLKE